MRSEADLREAQQRAATAFYEHDAVMAVLPMGSGKTASALTALQDLLHDGEIRRALVVAPKRVAEIVWPTELTEWDFFDDIKMKVINGTAKQRLAKLRGNQNVDVIGVDNLQWLLKELPALPIEYDLIVVDEISKFKNPRSKRGRDLRKFLKGKDDIIMWGLTGTPRANGYEDLWGQYQILTKDKLWPPFDKWRKQLFYPTDWRGYIWAPFSHAVVDINADIDPYTIRLRDEDMPDLPPLVEVEHKVEMPPKAWKAYGEMWSHLVSAFYNEGDLVVNDHGLLVPREGARPKKKIDAANMAVASGKCCQLVQGFMYHEGPPKPGSDTPTREVEWVHDAKLDELVEIVEGLDGEPTLIAYEFQEDLARLKTKWPKLQYLGAGVTTSEADRAIHAWNSGALDVMGIHPASGGHGLNLQFGGRRLIQYGLTWSAEMYDQLIKRFQRPGSLADRCYVHFIIVPGTTDTMKIDRVVHKMNEQEAFIKLLKEI